VRRLEAHVGTLVQPAPTPVHATALKHAERTPADMHALLLAMERDCEHRFNQITCGTSTNKRAESFSQTNASSPAIASIGFALDVCRALVPPLEPPSFHAELVDNNEHHQLRSLHGRLMRLKLTQSTLPSSFDIKQTTKRDRADQDSKHAWNWTAIVLPGADGSTFHFRGLMTWLSAMKVDVLAFDTKEFRGHASANAFCESIFCKVKDVHAHVCVFGYSNAGIIINTLAARFNLSSRPWDALVLFDPMYSREIQDEQLEAIETKMIASSVIDHEELDAFEYDWSALRGALLQTFPTYAARFEGFQLWRDIGSDITRPFHFSGNVTCPVLILVATYTEPMFEGVTGGRQCVPTWRSICPQAQVELIECRHVDIPFALKALEKSVTFLLALGGRVDHGLQLLGRKRMHTTLNAMSVAQKSFKSQWLRSQSNSTFRVERAKPGLIAYGWDAVELLLEKIDLAQYLQNLRANGYDDASSLLCLKHDQLLIVAHNAGMSKSEAHRFLDVLEMS